MKPVDQTILHDPENNVYGDCQRACIASLLELEISDVPHFFESGNDEEFNRSLNEYLSTKGFIHLELKFVDNEFPVKIPCYHMIYGQTDRGFHHAVIGLNGEVAYDPNPAKTGLLESDRENWTYAFLIPTHN